MPVNIHILIDFLDCLYMYQSSFYSKKDSEFYNIPFNCDSEEDKELAETIDENRDDFVRLPDKDEVNMYGIIENFIEECTKGEKQDKLYYAINKSKPFKHFYDAIYSLGLESKWFAYRDKRLTEIAIKWCKENNLEFL